MSVLVEFAMFPTDKGDSVSKYVSRIIKMIDEEGIPYQLTPMGTIFEVPEMENALTVINKAHNCLKDDCGRIYSTIKFDIQKNKSNRIKSKVESIENKIGKVNK